MATKKHHAKFSMEEKLKFINIVESGKKLSHVAKDHNIPKSTIGTWMKEKEKIKTAVEKGGNKTCRVRTTKNFPYYYS
jgi:transposase-like protein